MSVCTFFGHSDCYGLDKDKLRTAIEERIRQGTDTFYVGNHGVFDALVHTCLKQLSEQYPHIHYAVVLAYLPGQKRDGDDLSDAIYPEGIEVGPPQFAIERRNRWMLCRADSVICYVRRPWGGAYKFVQLAKKQGKKVVNLYEQESIP